MKPPTILCGPLLLLLLLLASVIPAQAQSSQAALEKFSGSWRVVFQNGTAGPEVISVRNLPGGGWKVQAMQADAEVVEVNAYRLLVLKRDWGGSLSSYYSISLTGEDTGRELFWQEGQGVARSEQNYDVRRTR